MDSTSASIPLALRSGLTVKQQKLLNELDSAISQIGIEIRYNDPNITEKLVALDVEHNESGEFVGCGIVGDSNHAHYFSDLSILRSLNFQSFSIIGHNGISDLECLRMWGINVRNEQLIWDSMLIGHIIDSSQKDFSLKGMAKRELSIVYPSYDDIVGKRGLKTERVTLDRQPVELTAKYNALDTYATYQLARKQGIHEIL